MKLNYEYLRTSTDDQRPEDQHDDIMSMNPPADLVKVTEQKSAWLHESISKRPRFKQIYIQIKRGNVATLYVWDLDRLFRNRKRLVSFFKLCKATGCRVLSYRQKWLQQIGDMPSPWNEIVEDMMVQIMGWMAEDESDKKSDRVKKAVVKSDSGTFSKYGNEWGRPGKDYDAALLLDLYKSLGSYRKVSAAYNEKMASLYSGKDLKKRKLSHVKVGELLKSL